ncbi:MAG: hypothetical protein GKR97_15040 [Rhizobiaceae bacterium]|nr:hypothetical protein [Rhizobiaceae bacterium]
MNQVIEEFVAAARKAAVDPEPTKAVRQVLMNALADPEPIADAIAATEENEILLHEDDTVSIWTCRFQPDQIVPPHEHKMDVHIGVFRGAENNILFRRDAGELKKAKNKIVGRGEVFSLGADGIHSVTADGSEPSLALHVYIGPLMQVDRNLFDWTTGDAVEFTMENFHKMTRPAADLDLI